jgi:3-keto-5-aminohexanoate cleavage enzyme
VEWRGQMLDLNVQMASLATGSSNFPSSVNSNSPELVEALALKMLENNIKPEIEAFDLAMISNAKYLMKRGILKGPLHFNLVLNVPGSIEGTPKNLMYMVDSLPPESTWSVTAVGRMHVPLISMAISLGGHVRTGLEDVIEYQPGIPATNAMLVDRVLRIAKAMERPIATPEDVKKILCL